MSQPRSAAALIDSHAVPIDKAAGRELSGPAASEAAGFQMPELCKVPIDEIARRNATKIRDFTGRTVRGAKVLGLIAWHGPNAKLTRWCLQCPQCGRYFTQSHLSLMRHGRGRQTLLCDLCLLRSGPIERRPARDPAAPLITDAEVCAAVAQWLANPTGALRPVAWLALTKNLPAKTASRAMERAEHRGLITLHPPPVFQRLTAEGAALVKLSRAGEESAG